jgi:hypothetical protein
MLALKGKFTKHQAEETAWLIASKMLLLFYAKNLNVNF